MSEGETFLFAPSFNRSVKVRGKDERITSDGGALLLREADHRLGITAELGRMLRDPRKDDYIRYTMVELLRERLYALALGYSAQDDLDRLAHDPAMKVAVWNRRGQQVGEERLASQPTNSRLLVMLAFEEGNLEAVRRSLVQPILRHQRAANRHSPVRHGTVDIDGFPIEAFGNQEGVAYNGYHGMNEYYPLVASFSAEGDFDDARLGDGFVHAILRKGNAAGAEGALRFIRNAVERARPLARRIDVRFDAAFTIGEIMDPLTDEKVPFVGRLRANPVLERMAAPLVRRPPGRPPKEGYEFVFDLGTHAAGSWRHPQRLILVVVDKPNKYGQLDLFPRYFFLVTNQHERDAVDLLEHYRKRGTFEDRLGEFNQALHLHLSSPFFHENEALFLLALLAFNLLSVLRGEIESTSENGWDLSRLQHSLLKAGARMVKGGRRLFFDIAAGVAPLWQRLLKRLRRWRWNSPLGPTSRPFVPPPAHAHLVPVLRI